MAPWRSAAWMAGFIADVHARVPHYRALGAASVRLADVEPVGRADLSAGIAAFVCDDASAERLITYSTSGTTGYPLPTPSHLVVAARYPTFHKRALARFGVTPRAGAGEVNVVLLGMQQRCFTYVSVTPTLDEAGLAKINLHPDAWCDPADRVRYLEALAPELLAGDPISFAELLELPVSLRPRALMSVSMMLATGLRARLEQRFGCPVLDLHSMNEVGPIGTQPPAATCCCSRASMWRSSTRRGAPCRSASGGRCASAAASTSACRSCATAPATMPPWAHMAASRC